MTNWKHQPRPRSWGDRIDHFATFHLAKLCVVLGLAVMVAAYVRLG